MYVLLIYKNYKKKKSWKKPIINMINLIE